MPDITCTKCGQVKTTKETAKGEARLPRAWKRHNGIWCDTCWSANWMMRAITIPVAGPVSCEWPEFREQLRAAWGESTRLANWLMTQYYARDIRRGGDADKLAPQPKTYLYPEARAECPSITPRSTVAIDHAIQGKYRALRYKLLWTGEVSLANFRYPYPLPIPSDCFRLKRGENGELLVDLRLLVDSPAITIRLRGGKDYIRQRRAIESCIDEKAIPVEATLYRVSANPSDHRNGEQTSNRVMFKVAAWLPRPAVKAEIPPRFFSIRTDQQSFLYGVLEDSERPWVVNADQMREWVRKHQRDLRRLGEDHKHGNRRNASRKKRYHRTLAEKSQKFFNRLDSFVKMTAASIVDYARRCRVTRIKFDDSYRDYVDSFPWAKLRQQLTAKCDEERITLELASSEVSNKTNAPLADSPTEGSEI